MAASMARITEGHLMHRLDSMGRPVSLIINCVLKLNSGSNEI